MLTHMKQRCKAKKNGQHLSLDSSVNPTAATTTTLSSSSTTTSASLEAKRTEELSSSGGATARGHASDDDCKRRRKENRKQLRREKRQAKEEARRAKRQQAGGSSSLMGSHDHEEQQLDESPRSEGGSWIQSTPDSSDDSELSAQHQAVPTSSESWTEMLSSTERSLSLDGVQSLHHSNTTSTLRRRPVGAGKLDFLSGVQVPASISNIGEAQRLEVKRVHLLYNPWSGNKKGGRLDFLSNVHVPASISNIGEAKRVDVRRVHLLYNPWSGNKKGEKKMRKARRLLQAQGKEVTVTKLLHKGHAEELCESMDLTGIDVLCSVGGDGTFHECVNGLMRRRLNRLAKTAESDAAAAVHDDDGDGSEATSTTTTAHDGNKHEELEEERFPPLAFIPAGTGNSFVHELGYVRTREAVRHICRGIEVGLDLNHLTYGEGETREECYSFNSIHWGIGSRVVDTAERFRWMGNSARYIMAALVELVKGNNGRIRLLITDENDREIVMDETYALGIANTIITAGKGMKLAPTAKIDDGLIDLLLFTSTAPKDLFAVLRKFYNGTHVDLPHVHYIKAKKFTVIPYKPLEDSESGAEESASRHNKLSAVVDEDDTATEAIEWFDDQSVELLKEVIDIDGELKGFTPFTCEVIPRALKVIL